MVEINSYNNYASTILLSIVNWIVGLIEFVLVLRLMLELLGAHSSSSFVSWVYDITRGLVAPFEGAFPAISLTDGYVFDTSVLFAIIAYIIIGFLINQLLSLLFSMINRL